MRKRIQMGGRIHIVIGLIAIIVAVPAFAADKKLVSASTKTWRTTARLFVQPNASSPAEVSIGRPGCATARVTLAPGEVVDVEDPAFQLATCGVGAFALLDPPAAGGAISKMAFNDGVTRSSFDVPPIGVVTADAPFTAFPVVSDDDDGVWINVFPAQSTDVRVTLAGQSATFTARPPVTQYRVPWRGAGVLRIELPVLICNLCAKPQPLYGFVTNGSELGGNLTVHPFN